MEEILTESEIKLDGVRQKILQVAQELSGEDMHQFHRAITTGKSSFTSVVTFFLKIVDYMIYLWVAWILIDTWWNIIAFKKLGPSE